MRAMGWTYEEYMNQPKRLLEIMSVDAETEAEAHKLALHDAEVEAKLNAK